MAETFAPAAPTLALPPAWRVWTAESRPAWAGEPGAAPFPLFEDIKGEFLTTAVVDRALGAVLTPGGAGAGDMEAGALAQSGTVDAAIAAADWLDPGDEVMEIRISTRNEVHFLRPIDPDGSMYLYVALDKEKGKYFDLAHMRIRMIELAFGL